MCRRIRNKKNIKEAGNIRTNQKVNNDVIICGDTCSHITCNFLEKEKIDVNENNVSSRLYGYT